MTVFQGFNAPEYTQTPNDLFDSLLREIDSFAELKVLLIAVRLTLGWHKEADAISLTRFEQLTGLSRQSVSDGIQSCLQRGTLTLAGIGLRGIRSYRLVMRPALVKEIDQSTEATSQDTLPVTSQVSRPVVPPTSQVSRPELVKEVDTQKKPKERDPKETGKETIMPIPRAPVEKPRQVLFGAIQECFNVPTSALGVYRGDFNQAVKILFENECSPDDFRAAYEKARAEWSIQDFKAPAVANWTVRWKVEGKLYPQMLSPPSLTPNGRARKQASADSGVRDADLERWQRKYGTPGPASGAGPLG